MKILAKSHLWLPSIVNILGYYVQYLFFRFYSFSATLYSECTSVLYSIGSRVLKNEARDAKAEILQSPLVVTSYSEYTRAS